MSMKDDNQVASENSPMAVDDEEGIKENSGDGNDNQLKNETGSKVTIHPTGVVQFFNENNHDVIEGTVYKATWTGNVSSSSFEQKPDSGQNSVNSFNLGWGWGNPSSPKARPPPPPPSHPKSSLTFADCGGLTKQVNFLKTAVLNTLTSKHSPKNPLEERFKLPPPKGILFYGPPGTGKTRLAQALGNEVSKKLGSPVHFIYRKGQDIATKYFGQSSANLRAVFDEAKAAKYCVLFFDELDGLCPNRDKPHINEACVTIVTTMLGLLDELPQGQVFVIGATNRIDAIDPALRRPGRFDKYLEFLPPAQDGRLEILKIHTRKWKVKPDENVLNRMSEKTVGYTGADLSKLALDAFDAALSRCLATNTVLIKDLDLCKLDVKVKDWNKALSKMKPTNLAIFGSTQYIPFTRFDDELDVLIREDCDELETMVLNFLEHEHKTKKDLDISSLYVHTQEEGSSLLSIDDVIIPEVLRSPKLGSHPVYMISTEILSSEAKTSWPGKVNSAFRQALEASDAILHIPDVQKLRDTIKASGYGLTLNLKGHLERARGSSVLILATSSIPATELSQDNPFKQVLSGSDNCYEIETPSDDKRRKYFLNFYLYLMVDKEWKADDAGLLAEAVENAVESTEGKDIGCILQLDEMIRNTYTRKIGSGESNEEVLRSLLEVTTTYKYIGQ